MTESLPEPIAKKPSEFTVRLISALFMAAFTVLVTWLGGSTFFLFAAILSVLILMEYRGIVLQSLTPLTGMLAFAFLALTIIAFAVSGVSNSFLIMSLGFVSLLLLDILLKSKPYAAIGLIYAGLPFIALVDLRGVNELSVHMRTPLDGAGLAIIFIIYGCVWGADSFAYLVGRSVGGPKLAPKISPNKTWSGFIGSLIGGVLISGLAVLFFDYSPGIWFVIVILITTVVSQLGDLVESLLKRAFSKKDSGTLIPGHGGVLDRVDGLIFASVFLWIIGVGIYATTETTSAETSSRANHIANAILPSR